MLVEDGKLRTTAHKNKSEILQICVSHEFLLTGIR